MSNYTVIHCGLLIDGTGQNPIEQGALVLQGERIVASGSAEELDLTPYAPSKAIDASNFTVLPGLIDCHSHICLNGDPDPSINWGAGQNLTAFRVVKNLAEAIMSGVLTMRDAAAPYGISFAARQAIFDGILVGPRLVVCGAALTMTGGHGHHLCVEADGSDGVRKAARQQLKQGADFIKLMATGGVVTSAAEGMAAPQFTVDEMRSAVEEAHKAGKRCAAHAIGDIGIRNALGAGVDTIEHGVEFNEETIELMLEAGAYLIPTFSTSYMQSEHGAELGIADYIVRKASEARKTHEECVRQAVAAGVPIALGTDVGGPGVRHGNIVLELELMRSAEVCSTNLDCLLAATQWGAKALGMEDEIGTLEVGKIADILVVDGNPLAELAALREVHMVIQNGQPVQLDDNPVQDISSMPVYQRLSK